MNNSTIPTDDQEEEFIDSLKRAEDLEKQCKFSKDKTGGAYAPLPLQREAPPAKPYPFDALGPIAGAAARRIHEVLQAPDATCGQSVLSALSLACQGFIDVHIDGRIHPTSLFMLTISESGERKSAADKVALKPISDWQRMLVDQHKKQFIEYKNQWDLWKHKRNAALKSASDGECDLTSLEQEPHPPCEGLILCDEPTIEGLEQLLERGQPSVGIFSDEGGRLVGGHAMNSENALKTACGLSNLWDGKPLTRVRKSEGSKIFYGRRLAVHLMIQPIVLMKLLNNEILMGQGLLSRCLFSAPMPIAGTRKYNEVDLSKDPAILAYHNLINKLLDQPYPKFNGQPADTIFHPGDALDPTLVLHEQDAKLRWIEFHNDVDSKMSEDGDFYPIKPFASKAAEQVNRIAAIFAFSERVAKDNTQFTIGLKHINRAITLIEYYLSEVVRVIGKNGGDPDIVLANLTLEWIKRNRPDQIFPIADIYQKGPSQIRNGKTAKRIMRILAEHEYVIEIKNKEIRGKKVRSAWHLVNDKNNE